MTKRFMYELHGACFRDDGKAMTTEEVVHTLNELHEEIEYLKPLANENTHYIADMEDDIITFKQKIEKLEKENEQLKTTIQQLTNDNTKQKKKLNTAMKENEHIKQTIKDMINTERTELGKMTLRQLWRQIQ